MIVKLLTKHRFEFRSFKGGCKGLSESTLVKMPHCWKSQALAQSQLCTLTLKKDPKMHRNDPQTSPILR